MFIKISDLLDQSTKKAGVSDQVEAVDVINHFADIISTQFTKTLKNRVKPLYLKNKTLTVSCESQVVASELKLHERKILQLLNKGQSEIPVRTIRFLL